MYPGCPGKWTLNECCHQNEFKSVWPNFLQMMIMTAILEWLQLWDQLSKVARLENCAPCRLLGYKNLQSIRKSELLKQLNAKPTFNNTETWTTIVWNYNWFCLIGNLATMYAKLLQNESVAQPRVSKHWRVKSVESWIHWGDKTPARSHYSLRERQHSFQLSNIEFLQFKNSFINRCLFKFRWLHSALQSNVFSEFCAYCSYCSFNSTFYFV